MDNQNIETIVKDAIEGIKNVVDTNTIIGNPIKIDDDITLLPISRVSVGFVAGGGELAVSKKKGGSTYPFAGGSTSGFSVSPVGFIGIEKGKINYFAVDNGSAVGDLVSMCNNVVNKIVGNGEKDEK